MRRGSQSSTSRRLGRGFGSVHTVMKRTNVKFNIALEEQLMNFDKIWVDLFLDVSDGFESVDSDEEL